MTAPVALFEPLTLRELTMRNRVWLSPMCQYSVENRDGVPTDWHLAHLGSMAIGGFGLIITEATAVTPAGRISPWDTGLWNDEQAAAWRRIVDFLHAQGAAAGVQLAHAGRKASTGRWYPGEAGVHITPEAGGWEPVGPGELPGDPPNAQAVHAMSGDDIEATIAAFADAARRALSAGFDVAEVHGAHGYLAHQFSSPLSNQRDDEWGGSFEGRTRFVRGVTRAVRAVWPADKPVFVRLSAVDWAAGGWTIEDSVRLAALLHEDGADLIDVSSGGLVNAAIPLGPGYQVEFAERIRTEAGVPTAAVGLINTPRDAEAVVAGGRADAVLLGRAALRDPNWVLRAAHELGVPDQDAPWHPSRWRAYWR